MDITYSVKGNIDTMSKGWNGCIRMIHAAHPYECLVTARGSSFHLIIAKHCYGNYICIPDWEIGTNIAALNDRFWNLEHLTSSYPEMSPVDLRSITYALAALNEYIQL